MSREKYPEQAILAMVTGDDGGTQIDYAIIVDPKEYVWQCVSDGLSVFQVFAEHKENLYVVLAPFGHAENIPTIVSVIDRTFNFCMKDSEDGLFDSCKVPQSWVEGMTQYGK